MTPITVARTPALGWKPPATPNATIEVARQRDAIWSRTGAADESALIAAPASDDKTIGPEESSAQNISSPSAGADEAEDDLSRVDSISDEFAKLRDEAERLQREIVDIEGEIADGAKDAEQRLASREIDQIIACWQMWMLVEERKVAIETVNEYADKAEVKEHKNQKIPCSRLMRAIVASGLKQGDLTARRRRQRATTYASVVDYVTRNKWTLAEVQEGLVGPPKTGSRYGIEYLASRGRKARREAEAGQRLASPLAKPYAVTGDFTDVKPGSYLMRVDVAENAAEMVGAFLKVTEPMFRHVIAADETARSQGA